MYNKFSEKFSSKSSIITASLVLKFWIVSSENFPEKTFIQAVFFSKIEAKWDLPENFSPYRLSVFLIHFGQQLIKLYASWLLEDK